MSETVSEVEEILRRWDEDPDDAKDRLIVQAHKALYAWAHLWLHNSDDVRRFAESYDLAQEAAVRLMRALKAVRPVSAEHFWNLCAKQVRLALLDLAKRRKGAGFEGKYQSDPVADENSSRQPIWEQQTADAVTPASAALNAEQVEALLEAVGTVLTEKQQRVFDQLLLNDMKFSEAARALEIDESTVRRRHWPAIWAQIYADFRQRGFVSDDGDIPGRVEQ